METIRHKRDDREQPQQRGRCASDRRIGPLALRLQAEMTADLLERHLHRPATNEPREHLQGRGRLVRAQKGFRGELRKRIPHQYPADRHDGLALVAPDGGASSPLDLVGLATVPVRDNVSLPVRTLVLEYGLQLVQAFASFARLSRICGAASGQRIENLRRTDER